MRPPPQHHLDRRALTAWRLSGVVETLVIGAIAFAAAYILGRFFFPQRTVTIVALVLVVLTASGIWPAPDLRWRRWRYEIGETEVDLQHGWLTVTRTLIPAARIQHVDTQRGPIQRRLGLATVILYTAAGQNQIPDLALEVADQVRDRVAALANVAQDV